MTKKLVFLEERRKRLLKEIFFRWNMLDMREEDSTAKKMALDSICLTWKVNFLKKVKMKPQLEQQPSQGMKLQKSILQSILSSMSSKMIDS